MSLLSGINRFVQTVNSTAQQVNRTVNQVGGAINAFQNLTGNPASIMSSIRRGGTPSGAQYQPSTFTNANFNFNQGGSEGTDWRVKIHMPTLDYFQNSSILAPLAVSGGAMVFPSTPQILVTHAANYNSLSPTHSNYPYPIYQNSAVEDITITGDFPVDNEEDGKYWIAAVHFLRSMTKMSYGASSNAGTPPPLGFLSGYGDFMFNRLPIVVKLFTTDLPDNVDYIKVPLSNGGFNYVPTLSRLNVTVQPVFSRNEVSQFNTDEFVRGGYVGTGKGFI